MSITNKGTVQCRHCGFEMTVDIHKSINTASDPELKAKVLDGSIFLQECPECGQNNLLSYECLYHDPVDKLMVWTLPFGEPEGLEKDAIMNQVRAMGDYRLRIVANAGDMMEKVIISEAGLDDRCIELVKYVAVREQGMGEVSNLHFYRIQDDVLVFSGMKDGNMASFGIGMNVYEDCEGILARNPELARENGFENIGQEWVSDILG